MALNMFSDMSAAGPSVIDLPAVLRTILLLLAEYSRRARRRGACTRGRILWQARTESAADQSCRTTACYCGRITSSVEAEDSAAGQNREPLTAWTLGVAEEDGSRASCHCHVTMLDRLLPNLLGSDERRPAPELDSVGGAWECTEVRRLAVNVRRKATYFEHSTVEVSADDVSRIAEMLSGNTSKAKLDRSTAEYVILCTTGLRYRFDCLKFVVRQLFHEDRPPSSGVSGHGQRDTLRDWDKLSLLCWVTIGGCLNSTDGFSIDDVQEQDDDGSHDWSERSCGGSIDDVSESQDVSCLDQDTVCTSDDDSDDAHCRVTLPAATLTASTALVKMLSPRAADSNTTVASSSRQLASSSSSDDDYMNSSVTELDSSIADQLDGNDDGDMDDCENDDGDMDDCESVSSSTTTTEQELLLRQRDVDEDIAVSVAREQTTTETTHNGGTPWWLVPGFRFAPTDQELVQHYLKLKVLNIALPRQHPVAEGYNVYALDADEIPLDGRNGDKERLGFFFVREEDKGTYSSGCYHATPEGYWRIRGRPARVRQCGRTIAFKTPMDFYRGRPPHGCRTPWSMFEYALNAADWRNDDLRNTTQPWMNSYVVCKVRKRELQAPSDGRAERFCRGLLPRRPFFKKVSPRSFRLEKIVDGAPPAMEEEETAPERVGGEKGLRGNRMRPNMF